VQHAEQSAAATNSALLC